MNGTTSAVDEMKLTIVREIQVDAPIAVTFEAVLEEMGPSHQQLTGLGFPMTLEPWPGGRWFRDLGEGNGHLWGHVQVIRRPTLLEICGPLFMSYAVINNVQYRLTEVGGGTLIRFQHLGFGPILEEHRTGVLQGWTKTFDGIHQRAATIKSRKS